MDAARGWESTTSDEGPGVAGLEPQDLVADPPVSEGIMYRIAEVEEGASRNMYISAIISGIEALSEHSPFSKTTERGASTSPHGPPQLEQ